MTVRELQCIVCFATDNVKYKCPICRFPFCSLNCGREHKLAKCEPAPKPPCSPQRSYEYPTADTVPIEKLKLLRNSAKLKEIMSNPHLRRMMESINTSPNASQATHEAMLEPIFVEFADECLRIVQDSGDTELDF